MDNTSIDGIYAVYITGQSGNGLIMLVLKSGLVTGADVTGTLFDGSYISNDGGRNFYIQSSVNAPPNGVTVQGVNTGPSGIIYNVNFVLPSNFDEVDFLEIQTPLGPVNAKFQKLRSVND
jgi:hypothetical protein